MLMISLGSPKRKWDSDNEDTQSSPTTEINWSFSNDSIKKHRKESHSTKEGNDLKISNSTTYPVRRFGVIL
jgi:hypothetical protein